MENIVRRAIEDALFQVAAPVVTGVSSFVQLVGFYFHNDEAKARVEARCHAAGADDLTFEKKVLLHKLLKHGNNPRSQAKYVAAFFNAYGRQKLGDPIAGLLRGNGVRHSLAAGVGYLNADGTYHWFEV